MWHAHSRNFVNRSNPVTVGASCTHCYRFLSDEKFRQGAAVHLDEILRSANGSNRFWHAFEGR